MSDQIPVMVARRDPNGTGVCSYGKEPVELLPDHERMLAEGGDVICQQCMAHLLKTHPEAIEGP